MSQKQSTTVRIAGEEYSIRASATAEYTRTCARYVDDRIAEIRQRSGLIETHKAAILAALSITDEYLQVQEELEKLDKEVASRAANLTRRIEAAAD